VSTSTRRVDRRCQHRIDQVSPSDRTIKSVVIGRGSENPTPIGQVTSTGMLWIYGLSIRTRTESRTAVTARMGTNMTEATVAMYSA
jgi:hypothetical protein